MDHTLPECSLELKYLHGQRVIAALDRQRLFNELLLGKSPREALAWAIRPVLTEYDHLVVAYELKSGLAVGLLGASDHETSGRPFLWLETGFVAETARGRNLLRRMIAVMLMRVLTLKDGTAAVATMTCNPIAVHVIERMARELRDVRFAPAVQDAVVDLATVMLARDIAGTLGRRFEFRHAIATAAGLEAVQASLARGYGGLMSAVSPMLAILDLRPSYQPGLLTDLRKMYRRRPRRTGRITNVQLGLSVRTAVERARCSGNLSP